ncbi:MAG: NAD-dependent epimerase/dehydratase family protein [Candidatus Eisenbacteria bacterium]|uniref:NAD-dependent epimerase/dehydratase family protein n=1 Tax=Eiseniibacteriota bacterium TaxID=2212470 RepID=A0A538SWN8_UNCEI|nr:MAG: NAD-dependent epimerase/dehydratase family protein [Candidatus Eisenbacteria bacterium]
MDPRGQRPHQRPHRSGERRPLQDLPDLRAQSVTAPLALVTGASGFVGSHIVDELLRRGARVRCLLRSTSSRRWLEGKPVDFAEGDVRHREGLDAAVAGADWIVHAAGLTHAPSAEEFHRANVLGTEQILAAALGTSPAPRRFLYISSQAAAGPSRNGAPVTEDLEPRPVSASISAR